MQDDTWDNGSIKSFSLSPVDLVVLGYSWGVVTLSLLLFVTIKFQLISCGKIINVTKVENCMLGSIVCIRLGTN